MDLAGGPFRHCQSDMSHRAFTIRTIPYGQTIYLPHRTSYMVSTFLMARRANGAVT
jgi:hypothetical protein